MISDYIPPWVGPCGLCEKLIGERDYYVSVDLEEKQRDQKQDLLNAWLCSNRCLEKLISSGKSRFGKKIKHFSRDEKPEGRMTDVFSVPVACSYCGEQFDPEDDYHLELCIQGGKLYQGEMMLLNSFCKKECYKNALDLGDNYLNLAASACFSGECIIEQQKKDERR